jgi:hypothetical protein
LVVAALAVHLVAQITALLAAIPYSALLPLPAVVAEQEATHRALLEMALLVVQAAALLVLALVGQETLRLLRQAKVILVATEPDYRPADRRTLLEAVVAVLLLLEAMEPQPLAAQAALELHRAFPVVL